VRPTVPFSPSAAYALPRAASASQLQIIRRDPRPSLAKSDDVGEELAARPPGSRTGWGPGPPPVMVIVYNLPRYVHSIYISIYIHLYLDIYIYIYRSIYIYLYTCVCECVFTHSHTANPTTEPTVQEPVECIR